MRCDQVYTMIDWAAGWLLPPRCVLCRGPGQRPTFDLCAACEGDLPVVPWPCARCGLPRLDDLSAGTARGDCCGRCQSLDLPYQRCLAAWAYEFPVTRLVQALKYEGALANARVFGMRLAAMALVEPQAAQTLVVPMPLHPRRLAERGFNQSREIARVMVRHLGRPLVEPALRRIRATTHQVGLSRAARLGNLHGAFMADANVVAGRRVMLVDDVVTTGSTAVEAAATLVAAGATHVEIWAVARTLE
jgi:ComF family protein